MNQTKMLPAKLWRLMGLLAVFTILVILSIVLLAGYIKVRLFLLWNLFLAWLPLAFALWIFRLNHKMTGRIAQIPLWLCWLFFFPNAPYMLTDIIHLTWYNYYQRGVGFLPNPPDWLALLQLMVAIVTGCLFGMVSLYLLHHLVRGQLGAGAGWCFVSAVSALSGAAIYIGRIMRFNTWDLVTRPLGLLQKIWESLSGETLLLYGIFGLYTLMAYLVFYHCVEPWENPAS